MPGKGESAFGAGTPLLGNGCEISKGVADSRRDRRL